MMEQPVLLVAYVTAPDPVPPVELSVVVPDPVLKSTVTVGVIAMWLAVATATNVVWIPLATVKSSSTFVGAL